MLEEMASFFEKRLTGSDQHMLTEIEGAAQFYEFTAKQLPIAMNCNVLDLGCGTGLELEAYLARNGSACITGIDLSQGMLNALKDKFSDRQMELICGSYFYLPFGEDRFDAAVSVESLHHFTAEQKLPLYQKLYASLKAKGYFILTDYFAESEAKEKEYFETLQQLRAEQGITGSEFYHYDTPLTVGHEIRVLRAAGFSRCTVLRSWGATCTVKIEK